MFGSYAFMGLSIVFTSSSWRFICVGYCEFWVSPDFVSWLKILAVFIAWVLGFYCVLLALSSCYSDFYLDNLNFIS